MTKKFMIKAQRDRIMKEYKELFEILENYDRTRKLPFKRKRIDITLSNKAIDKLRAISITTGKSMSRIIEEKLS